MYKEDYTSDDYVRIVDECSNQIKNKLQRRYDELEELRTAINDRHPFEDLYLQWAKVDYEEELIHSLLENLNDSTLKIKKGLQERWTKAGTLQ